MGLSGRLSGMWGKRKRLLGVDIGSASVKVLELSAAGGGLRVESCALEALPPNAVVDGNIRDFAEVGEALKRARVRSGSSASRAALVVGESAVIRRTITVEASLTDTEIMERIVSDGDAEANRFLPFPSREMAIDFEVRGLSERHPEAVDVTLVACRKTDMQRLDTVLSTAGLEPTVVEPKGQALERLLEWLEPRIETQAGEWVVAVAEIGAGATTLWVLVDGRVAFSRTEALAARQPVVDVLVRSLRFFYSSTHYSDIDHMLLAGAATAPSGPARDQADELVHELSRALKTTASVVDPFAGMSVSRRVDEKALAANAPALTFACGLALRGCQ